jgi:hypothetical protein
VGFYVRQVELFDFQKQFPQRTEVNEHAHQRRLAGQRIEDLDFGERVGMHAHFVDLDVVTLEPVVVVD